MECEPKGALLNVSLREHFDDKLAGLEARIKSQMDERDIRYLAMFASRDTAIAAALAAQEKAVTVASSAAEKAVNAALAAQEKTVSTAAEASEKAIAKAEVAQMGVNERGNEFRKSLDDYVKNTMPRTEAQSRFDEVKTSQERTNALVEELRRSESRTEGGAGSRASSKQQANWLITLIISVVMGALTIIFACFLSRNR